MIEIKKSPYGRTSKSYQIRLDDDRSSKLTRISEQANVRPTTAATQLLESAIDKQYEAVANHRTDVLNEKAESALRKLLRQGGNGGYPDTPRETVNGEPLPYTLLDVVIEEIKDILAKSED